MLIFTNGVFDLFHAGHVDFLEQIYEFKKQNDNAYFVVGINSDKSARILKGPGRPVIPAEERKRILEATKFVDEVIIFDTPTASVLIWMLRPDVYFKGHDYLDAPKTVEQVLVESYGGKVMFTRPPERESLHTTDIINRIIRAHAQKGDE